MNFKVFKCVLVGFCLFGILGHLVSLIGYFAISKRHYFGLDIYAPIVRVSLTRYISYETIMKYLPFAKASVEIIGLISWILLFVGSFQMTTILYIMGFMILGGFYLTLLIIRFGLIAKMIKLGVSFKSLQKEMIPWGITFTVYILGFLFSIILLIKHLRDKKSSNLTPRPKFFPQVQMTILKAFRKDASENKPPSNAICSESSDTIASVINGKTLQ